MASIYMRIDGLDSIKGAATVADIGGKKGFFAIDHVSWGADRGVGINVGNANNSDKGMAALGEIQINRTSDGASPHLTTFLFSPGADGKTIDIVMTKPNREGGGMDPYMVITLEKARMSHYNISCGDGELPHEQFNLTYATISKVYYTESDSGKIEKGDTVKFDTTTGKLESKAS
ncbi:Hcp family type VI secretion system effector [Marinobacterium arenosum]|uniref:Hcp family type VI secretion system effector n=1 Tax=Marinobacterium arenosum TaxID=2862496 RepID=UPI001C97285F|nr:type VI secretion system tube protein Hcp [Marinobacterium arenosum]MBY4677085.1 type VI secretion system tube protein Hcp [Marinobacterium arenosum]